MAAQMTRARAAREARRTAQFAKFRITELNLVPLVDTFVAIVFFSLATATVGEMAPVMPGVTLPDSRVGGSALQELTLGIGPQVTLNATPIMSTRDAASAQSNNANEPLLIPQLYSALKQKADSLRQASGVGENESVKNPLAIQGDKTIRYALLARVMQTARLAGFRNVSLQVNKTDGAATGTTPAATPGQRGN
jgi:biopolymer transport protein ExbD